MSHIKDDWDRTLSLVEKSCFASENGHLGCVNLLAEAGAEIIAKKGVLQLLEI